MTRISNVGEKIREIRNKKALTQVQLSDLCGWGKHNARIASYEKGTRNPSYADLKKIANALRIKPEFFILEDPQKLICSQIYKVPLLDNVSAGQWVDKFDKSEVSIDTKIIPTAKPVSEKAFALKVSGDSMTSPFPSIYNFPDGAIIIVEPEKRPENDAFVIVRDNLENSFIFKQLKIDAKKIYLVPLNPQYPTFEINEDIHKIIGVVIQSILDT